MESKSKLHGLLLASILFLALALRLWGIDWGLPSKSRPVIYYGDEYTVIWLISRMHPAEGDFNMDDFRNPSFFYYQVAAALKVADIFGVIKITSDKEFYRANRDEYGKLFIVGRLLVVLYSLLSIVLIYFLTREAFNATAGLWASFLLAVTPISVYSAHCLEISTPLCFWAGCCMLACLKTVRTKSLRWFYASLVFWGFAFSTKYLAGPMLLPIFISHYLSQRKIVSKALFIGAAVGLGAFILGTPFVALDYKTFFHDFVTTAKYTGLQQKAHYNFAPVHLGYAMGWPLFLTAVAGFAWSLAKKDLYGRIAGSFLISFLLILSVSALQVSRYYMMPSFFLLPFAALIFSRFTGAKKLIAAAIIIPSFLYSVAYAKLLNDPNDTRDQASQWISENIPKGNAIGVISMPYWYSPPVIYSNYAESTDERYQNRSKESYEYNVTLGDFTKIQPWGEVDPPYLVMSDTEMLQMDDPEVSATLKERLMQLGYQPEIVFERHPKIGPIEFPKRAYYTTEWYKAFLTITVWKKT